MPILPTPRQIEVSQGNRADSFYQPPAYIGSFIETCEQKLEGTGFYVRLWSIARIVTLFDCSDQARWKLTYEEIQDHPERALKRLLNAVDTP